ncbi:MAG: hypothetical protein GY706_06060, partial [Bacteroides sp.]|nr:hypothetical protein [Bacteroides sp.]
PEMNGIEYLVYSTAGGTIICLSVVIVFRWYHLRSNNLLKWKSFVFPREYLFIIPSGICTALVIPTTTLMYTLPISIMVAMVIMRGSLIVISRLIDAVQIRQGILTKQVYMEENIAVVFALTAVAVHLFWNRGTDNFDFLSSVPAVMTLVIYISAYTVRIYIMNYYKNTRPKGIKNDNRAFFAIEQISSSITLALVAGFMLASSQLFGWHGDN